PLGDALISSSYGVTVYGENVQTGGWLLVVEIAAVLAVTVGCIQLSRSLSVVHGTRAAPRGQRRMITGSPGTFTSVWKKAAMSMGIRTQPCETGASGTSVSPWMANAVPMKNTGLYISPSGTTTQPGRNTRV